MPWPTFYELPTKITNLVTENGTLKDLVRSTTVKGSLKENITRIVHMIERAGSSKQQIHLTAVLSVAEHILKYGPVVVTQQLVRVYKEKKQ